MYQFRSMKVVLGSQSKWRRQLLSKAGLEFTCDSADIGEVILIRSAVDYFTYLSGSIDEKAISLGDGERDTADPSLLTLAIAKAKAKALLPKYQGQHALLITSGITTHTLPDT